MKIVYVASAGGHLTEIYEVIRKVGQLEWLVTERSSTRTPYHDKTIYLPYDSGRNRLRSALAFIRGLVAAVGLLARNRDVTVISTGSHVAVPFAIVARFLGNIMIHVESYARVRDLSRSGKLIYQLANVFYVQWEELLTRYPRAIYHGRVF